MKQARFSHPGLGIDVMVPALWNLVDSPDFPVLLLAPPGEGFRTNLGLSRSTPITPPTAAAVSERMSATIAAARGQQKREYPGFAQLSEEHFELEGRPAFLQTYEWQVEGAPEPFTQVFGLVAADPSGLLELNGATLHSLAPTMLPLLIAIVKGIRLIERE